ncbi:MAG TPA: TetR/AcrR family transcriptional regulator [Acidimicrobiales bacterium]|nr:TetR/AcrR family transcriptional regulator [Acidimicrobiales bacterium]
MARQTVTRREAKERTRQALLDAALAVLDEQGEPGLTTTAVTQRAGIAQSSFYVHFADMDELLRHLVDQLWDERRTATYQAGVASRRHGDPPAAAVRELFRATVTRLVAHPEVLRLVMRRRLDPGPLGDRLRAQLDTSRANLARGLAAGGAPDATREDRRRLAMRADGLIAMVDALALGHLDGRYPDVDEILDVLVSVSTRGRARAG